MKNKKRSFYNKKRNKKLKYYNLPQSFLLLHFYLYISKNKDNMINLLLNLKRERII